MGWQYTPFAGLALAGSVAAFAAAIASWRRRPAPGAAMFALFIFSAGVWSLAFGLQLSSQQIHIQQILYKAEWFGVLTLCCAWLIFGMQFTRQTRLLTRPLLIGLALFSLVTWGIIWTNDLHHLMYTPSHYPSPIVEIALLGPWFWITRLFTYLTTSGGLFFILRKFLQSSRYYRLQLLPLAAGVTIPFFADLTMILFPGILGGLSLTSLAMTFGALLAARGFLGYGLIGIVPGARDAVIRNMQDGVIVLDTEDTIVDINPAAEKLLNRPANLIIGQGAEKIFAFRPDLVERFRSAREARVEISFGNQSQERTFDFRLSSLASRNQRVTGRLLVLHEITELKKVESALRENEERYALAARGANDGLWDWDLKADRLYYSPRWKAILGFQPQEIGDQPDEWLARIHPEDLPALRRTIDAHLSGEAESLHSEHRVQRKDGSYCWVLARGVAPRAAGDEPTRMAGSMTDISQRKKAEERLKHDALHDGLTGLPNRVFITERIRHCIQRARRKSDYQFAVLFLDLDRFKVINDSLGHLVGDQLLIAVAQKLGGILRQMDCLARLGGDEFIILLDEISERADAMQIAERVRHELQSRFLIGKHEIYISTSIGIAFGHTGYASPEELFRDADLAMYNAKGTGRACFSIFDAQMHSAAISKQEIEADLRRGLQEEEFVLHYLPVLNLRTGALVSLEALLRWQHPERGLLDTDEFLEIAEETNLIIPLGAWVIEEACRQLSTWQTAFPHASSLSMSINLSARQLRDSEMVNTLKQNAERQSIPPGSLIMEIPENVIGSDSRPADRFLNLLKLHGFLLHIDDFGTGFCSLNILHEFPFDALKIDRSFISQMTQNHGNQEIVRTIIDLGRNLNKPVIAEGIETQQDLDLLRSLNCELGQGFHLAAPMQAGEVEVLIAARSAPASSASQPSH